MLTCVEKAFGRAYWVRKGHFLDKKKYVTLTIENENIPIIVKKLILNP